MKSKYLFFNALLFIPSFAFSANLSQGATPAVGVNISSYALLTVVILFGGVLLGFKYRSGYKTAKGISIFVSFVGWLLFIGGILFAFFGLVGVIQSEYGGASIFVIFPGIGAAVCGLLFVMGGQVTRAMLDTANHTREIMNILREKS